MKWKDQGQANQGFSEYKKLVCSIIWPHDFCKNRAFISEKKRLYAHENVVFNIDQKMPYRFKARYQWRIAVVTCSSMQYNFSNIIWHHLFLKVSWVYFMYEKWIIYFL